MSCPDKQVLSAWMDNELTEAETEEIASHINSCLECKNYINSQKLLETVWREGWEDPVKKDFEQMRNTLQQKNPSKKWWKTERTWYIAAVLCAAYLGVKIFVVDNAGTSLSDIAMSEQINDAISTSEVSSEVPELEAEVVVENDDETEELIIPAEEAVEIEPIVAFEYTELDMQESPFSVDDIVAEGSSGYSATGYGSGGILEEETGETDAYETRIADNTLVEFAVSDAPAGISSSDTINSVTSGATGGGSSGGTDHRMVGGSVAAMPEEYVEHEVLDVVAQSASADTDVNRDRTLLKNCSVQVVLSSGTIASVSSSLWPSLFDLLESILENNPLFENSDIMLLIDEAGTVSGPGVEDSIVIELPDQSYLDCVIHIHF